MSADLFAHARAGVRRAWVGPALAVLVLLLFCYSVMAAAPQRFVRDAPVLLTENGDLKLKLCLSVDNEDGLADMLRDGASLELTVKAHFDRVRTFWMNESLEERVYTSTLRHDALTREFILTMPRVNGETVTKQDRNLRRLLNVTWKHMLLPVIAVNRLDPSQRYALELDLSLRYAELPPWLERTLVLWSKDIVPAETIKMEYVPDAALSR